MTSLFHCPRECLFLSSPFLFLPLLFSSCLALRPSLQLNERMRTKLCHSMWFLSTMCEELNGKKAESKLVEHEKFVAFVKLYSIFLLSCRVHFLAVERRKPACMINRCIFHLSLHSFRASLALSALTTRVSDGYNQGS